MNIDHHFQRLFDMTLVIERTKTSAGTRKLPITEESLIWKSDPALSADGTVDKESADYTVAGIADGLNELVVALKARKKNA